MYMFTHLHTYIQYVRVLVPQIHAPCRAALHHIHCIDMCLFPYVVSDTHTIDVGLDVESIPIISGYGGRDTSTRCEDSAFPGLGDIHRKSTHAGPSLHITHTNKSRCWVPVAIGCLHVLGHDAGHAHILTLDSQLRAN